MIAEEFNPTQEQLQFINERLDYLAKAVDPAEPLRVDRTCHLDRREHRGQPERGYRRRPGSLHAV